MATKQRLQPLQNCHFVSKIKNAKKHAKKVSVRDCSCSMEKAVPKKQHFLELFFAQNNCNVMQKRFQHVFFTVLIFDVMCDLISKRKGKERRMFIYTTASYLPWKNGNDPFLRKQKQKSTQRRRIFLQVHYTSAGQRFSGTLIILHWYVIFMSHIL